MLNQLLLPGFPEGAIKIGSKLSILNKDGRVTYFVGSDNYFSHGSGDQRSRKYALATLMENGHVRPRDLEEPPLGLAHRTLMNWTAQLRKRGADSFFCVKPRSLSRVMTSEKVMECSSLLDDGMRVTDIAKQVGVGESTLRKAIARGAIKKKKPRRSRGKAVPFEAKQEPRNLIEVV